MKKLLALLLVACLTIAMAACSNNQNNPSSGSDSSGSESSGTTASESSEFPTEEISLRWSFWASSEEMVYWQSGLDSYTEKHPNVKFTIETTPWSEYWDKLATQVASQSQPDITGMTTGTSRMFMANGALLPLNDYMDQASKDPDSGWSTDDYWDGVFLGYTLDDKVYGIPYDMGPQALCLNMDLFEEFGVDLPKDGWSIDEAIEIAKKLTVDRDGDGVTDVYGMAWTPDGDYFQEQLVLSLGTEFVSGEEPNQTVQVSPVTAEFVQKLADGFKEGWNYDVTAAQDLGLFQSGQVAMIAANPEWFGKYAKLMDNPHLYAMQAPMSGNPEYDTGAKYIAGGGFSIGSNTEYPDVCWDFLKSYLNEDGVRRCTAEPFRGIPPLKGLLQDFYDSEFAPENVEALTYFLTREDAQNSFYSCPNQNALREIVNDELSAVFSGTQTAQEAVDAIVEKGNKIVKEPE